MRKFALAVLLTFLLAGCNAVKLIAGPSEEPGILPADSSKPASVSQPPSAPPAAPDSSPSAAPASGESASSSAPEAATASSEETEEPAGQPDPFDAAEAVTVEAAFLPGTGGSVRINTVCPGRKESSASGRRTKKSSAEAENRKAAVKFGNDDGSFS